MRKRLVSIGLLSAAFSLLGATPAPVPAPSESPPTPLKEIGSVRTSVCSTVVVHANSAIDATLANDANLRALIVSLSTAGVDDATDLSKRNTYRALENAAAKMRETALEGEAEVRRLRALAADSPEPRKSELKAFADAIGGALYRQRMMAIEAQRLVAVQQGREESHAEDVRSAPDLAFPPRPGAYPTRSAAPTAPPSVEGAFKIVAADFAQRGKRVAIDEGIAADHALGAATGC
jgi:hypothetical protein